MTVNGKEYPMWSQFVEKKKEWIGGVLQEFADGMDKAMFGVDRVETVITDIALEPNGETSAVFSVEGKDFGCGCDVHHLGIGAGDEGWITFYGYGNQKFRIKKPKVKEENK